VKDGKGSTISDQREARQEQRQRFGAVDIGENDAEPAVMLGKALPFLEEASIGNDDVAALGLLVFETKGDPVIGDDGTILKQRHRAPP
jgi:hypothetical protein